MFRWLAKPDAEGEHGVIRINGTPYLVSAIRSDAGRKKDRVIIGWRLVKADRQSYDIYPKTFNWECDCPDSIFGRDRALTPELRVCKRCAALRAALPQAGHPITVPSPIEPDLGDALPDAPGVDGDDFAYSR